MSIHSRENKVGNFFTPDDTAVGISALKGLEPAYWLVADTINEGAIKLELDGTILYCNLRFAEMVKLPRERINGVSIRMFVDSLDVPILEMFSLQLNGKKKEIYLRANDGSLLPVCVFVSGMKNEVESRDVCLLLVDLTEKKKAEQACLEAERSYQEVFENAVEGMFRLAKDGSYLKVNPALVRMLGYPSPESFILNMNEGRNFLYVDQRRRAEYIRLMQERGTATNFESQIHCKNGKVIWISENVRATYNSDGTFRYFEGSVEDITARKYYEAQLAFHASYDELTGLPNRYSLFELLRRAIVAAGQKQHLVAVAIIDLDQFKLINDSLGHNIGDHLLKKVAARLKSVLRDGDVVTRFGGDEFVLVLDQFDESLISHIMPKLLQTISTPIIIGDREFNITCSIGFSLYPIDGGDVESLLKNANAAMHHAKEQGRNNFQFYTQELNQKITSRLSLESCLRKALSQQQFFMEYQPKVALRTGKIVGLEALIRWRNELGQVIAPMDFIPLAEENGLIVPIGEWSLRTACLQNKMWQESGLPPISVSVNLSARQFRQKNLVELIARILLDTGLDPQYLELELTESVVMQSVESATITMSEFKSLGVLLSIDDFGTGYSSLSYLKNFPIDVLKIDKTFVRDIESDPKGAVIIPSIIALAHSLNLKVIAEGVETKEQVDFLARHSCDEIQGYYFSKPVSVEKVTQLMQLGTLTGSSL